MSMFPWQNWFYQVSQKEADLNTEYNRYVTLCQTITANGAKLNNDLNVLNGMYLRNYALLIIATQAQMSQSDYAQWLVDNHALDPAMPKNSTVIEVMQGCADLIGIMAFGKMVWNIGAAVKNQIWSKASSELGEETLNGGESVADGLSEPLVGTEGVTTASDLGLDEAGEAMSESIVDAATNAGVEVGSEAGIEAAGEAVVEASTAAVGIATAGLAVVAAVGVDAILGAIQGAKESNELARAKAKLNKALGVTQQFSAKVNTKTQQVLQSTLNQQALFLKNMQLLNRIQPASFTYDYTANDPNATPSFVAAMSNAVAEYGWLPTIRTNYVNYLGNGYTGWSGFNMLMNMTKPAHMPKQVADGFLSYAKNKLIQPSGGE